jgi:hypothetical protein
MGKDYQIPIVNTPTQLSFIYFCAVYTGAVTCGVTCGAENE